MRDCWVFIAAAACLVAVVCATCGTTNSDAVANGHSATAGVDGFTFKANSATSYFLSEHITLTLNVPSGNDQWVAFEFTARNSTGKIEGSWDPTATLLVPSQTSTPSHLLCDTTNTLDFHLVSGATVPTFTTGHGSVQVTWIAPASSKYGTVSFFAAVSIDSATWFNINGPVLPYLAEQGKCVNPKTGNTTWTPYPICNGHGICEFNNTCVCNGTYTGPGCFTNTICGAGYTGKPGACVACAAGTYKPAVGVVASNTTNDDFLAGILGSFIQTTSATTNIGLVTTTLTVSGAPHTRLIVHGSAVFHGAAPSATFDNGTISDVSVQGYDIMHQITQARLFLTNFGAQVHSTLSTLYDGSTISPGIYASGNYTVSHTVTLAGPAGSRWVFVGGTLNFLQNSKMVMAGGADPCNVIWISGGTTKIGANATVIGTLFGSSGSSFTIHRGVHILGRVLNSGGTTTTIPDSGGTVTILPPSGCTASGLLTYDTTVCTRCRDTFGLVALDLAGKYALLTANGITVGNAPTIYGDVGAETGRLLNTSFTMTAGTLHKVNDADTVAAVLNATAAAFPLFRTHCTFVVSAGLATIRLTPGNYCIDGELEVTGPITFDGQGDPLSVWRIIVTGNINFGAVNSGATSSSVDQVYTAANDNVLVNGALNSNIFWIAGFGVQVTPDTTVNGNIISLGSAAGALQETASFSAVISPGVTTGNNVHVTGGIIALGAISLGMDCIIGDTGLPQHYIDRSRFTTPLAATNAANCSVSGSLCAAGKYFLSGSCVSCAIGAYKAATGDQQCSLCDILHTTPSTGTTTASGCSIALCPPGQTGPNGASCTACPIGSYKSSYGLQDCTLCPAGFSTAHNGDTSIITCTVPINCPYGFYNSTSGKGPCRVCGLGQYYNVTGGKGPCRTCPTGTYSTVAGASSITQCAQVSGLLPGNDLCSQFHFKQNLCDRFDAEGCVFNTTTGACIKQNCTFFTDQTNCNFVRTCRWYDPTGVGIGSAQCNVYSPSSSTAFAICNAIDSGYGTTYLGFDTFATACQAQPMCEYLCGTNHCVVERNIVATTPDATYAQCIQDGLGVWVQQTAECYDPGNPIGHTFTSYTDPFFKNFTCPLGVCIPRGRHNPTLFCLQHTAEACNSAENDNSCTWDAPLSRCLATENPIAYSLECDFCQFQTEYIQHFWDVTVATLPGPTCSLTTGCVLDTDCALKSHCRTHDGNCIANDAYLCPLLVSQYECTVTPGAGICALYNTTAVCRSALFPPTGWPAFSGPGPDSSESSVSVEDTPAFGNLPFHYNYVVSVHGFSYNSGTGILTFYLNMPLNWNKANPLETLVKIGYGGYPGLGYNFDLSTISGVTDLTMSGEMPPDFLDLAKFITTNHNLPAVCLVIPCLSPALSQNVYDVLNPTGISPSVVLLPDPRLGPVLQYKIQLNLGTILTAGANAGVSGTHVVNPNLPPVAGVLVASTTLTIPLTAVWRSYLGSTTVTEMMQVVVDSLGIAQVAISGQINHGVTATVSKVTFTTVGCSSGQLLEQIFLTLTYTTQSANQLWLGPLHVQDLTMLTNCYSATLGGFVAPICANGQCNSQVVISTACRTPTPTGDTFETCPSTLDPSFDGQFSIQVAPWFCENTGIGSGTNCTGQTLLQGVNPDVIETDILLPDPENVTIIIEGASTSSSSALSAGAIAGIVIGSVAGAILVVTVIVLAVMFAPNPGYTSISQFESESGQQQQPRPRPRKRRTTTVPV